MKISLRDNVQNIQKDQLSPKLKEFLDVVESYELIKLLSGNGKKKKEPEFLKYRKEKIETVLFDEFRVNLNRNNEIEVIFNAGVKNYEELLESLNKIKNITFTSVFYRPLIKFRVIVTEHTEHEDLLELVRLLNSQ